MLCGKKRNTNMAPPTWRSALDSAVPHTTSKLHNFAGLHRLSTALIRGNNSSKSRRISDGLQQNVKLLFRFPYCCKGNAVFSEFLLPLGGNALFLFLKRVGKR